MKAWHFLPDDGRLRFDCTKDKDNRSVLGVWYFLTGSGEFRDAMKLMEIDFDIQQAFHIRRITLSHDGSPYLS